MGSMRVELRVYPEAHALYTPFLGYLVLWLGPVILKVDTLKKGKGMSL